MMKSQHKMQEGAIPRVVVFTLRMSPELLEEIEDKAKSLGIGKSSWARMTLTKAVREGRE